MKRPGIVLVTLVETKEDCLKKLYGYVSQAGPRCMIHYGDIYYLLRYLSDFIDNSNSETLSCELNFYRVQCGSTVYNDSSEHGIQLMISVEQTSFFS